MLVEPPIDSVMHMDEIREKLNRTPGITDFVSTRLGPKVGSRQILQFPARLVKRRKRIERRKRRKRKRRKRKRRKRRTREWL